ncbi:endonuclease/exonuclease/phosphatase family protein [Antrihabitans spumae]|uniref:Endonuclease/exonuclease/phosphatase family protein n=1 Tax=Antrihabitans spumae TaxID=3373370 RepID=A0ABW7KHY4_9NOCA
MTLRIATWNTQWATPSRSSRQPSNYRGSRVITTIANLDADVIVITEGCRELLPSDGHIVDAGADWGYDAPKSRRKVLAWSRTPFVDLVRIDTGAGSGRVLTARTETPLGPIRVTAVCIPWMSAHVSTGRSDAEPWSEHLECCEQIRQLHDRLGTGTDAEPQVIAGDFNQRVPRGRQPLRVAAALDQLLDGWQLHTGGATPHGPLIDHIAATQLELTGREVWPARDDVGALSDHCGVRCSFRLRS